MCFDSSIDSHRQMQVASQYALHALISGGGVVSTVLTNKIPYSIHKGHCFSSFVSDPGGLDMPFTHTTDKVTMITVSPGFLT